MPTIECCKTCQHCLPGQASAGRWCRLRQITVHNELAPVVFCHHWTKRAPSLPRIEEQASGGPMDRQLEFCKALSKASEKDDFLE